MEGSVGMDRDDLVAGTPPFCGRLDSSSYGISKLGAKPKQGSIKNKHRVILRETLRHEVNGMLMILCCLLTNRILGTTLKVLCCREERESIACVRE